MREFSKEQDEHIEEEDRSFKISVVLGSICFVVIFILAYVLISRSLESLYDLIAIQHPSEVKVVTRDEDLPPVGEHVYQPFTSYEETSSRVFHMKNGELELYATVVSDKGVLVVCGQEYHAGGELLDGAIYDIFTYDSSIDKFVNQSQTIFISEYDGRQFKIEDKRDNVCLPFDGALQLK